MPAARAERTLVYDWRAPVSLLFYDYQVGLARYQVPSGEIAGQLTRKRQFRIREGALEFLLETDVNIVDEVLQEELSRSSDEGTKNIVATIQRDQNAIIRDAEAQTLIIQAVAGLGKTSIALYRIAFLLYLFKDTLSSEDILIISPNEELVPIERHGEPPQVVPCKRASEAKARILQEIEDFRVSGHNSLALIAKTQKQANRLHRQLTEIGAEARLLDTGSEGFSMGVIVCMAHLAKGLEFDRVIVPDANAETYSTELDRNLLYVACTRAMHRLSVLATGAPSDFLPEPVAA